MRLARTKACSACGTKGYPTDVDEFGLCPRCSEIRGRLLQAWGPRATELAATDDAGVERQRAVDLGVWGRANATELPAQALSVVLQTLPKVGGLALRIEARASLSAGTKATDTATFNALVAGKAPDD